MSKLKNYLTNRDTVVLLGVTLFAWLILSAGIWNSESVLSSLGQSYYEDGLFSFLFAGAGCIMIVGLAIAIPIKIIYDYRK